MKKTLISHFYNEEYLLPWFLKHHQQVFDHGIMINYGSTDRSVEIIREICPTWDIIDSRNAWFDPGPVDQEVMDIERSIDGWRICLNVTEHLIGDYSVLDNATEDQFLIPALFFIDRELNDELTYDQPLYAQRQDGFAYWDQDGACFNQRQARSLHRQAIQYPGMGRHFTNHNTDALAIFYYGWCPLNETAVGRKLDMGNKVPDWVTSGRHHTFPFEWINERYETVFLPWTRDLGADMQRYINDHNRYTTHHANSCAN
jgi:hypothetical protein